MEKNLEVNRFIEEMQDLPTLPVVMLKIFDCIDDPHSSAEDLKGIIINDVSISMRVLSFANSAFYGYQKEIEDITRAVVVLGFETIVDIALSVSLSSVLNPASDSLAIPIVELWKHSIATGEAARLLADENFYPSKERAFLIGLTHDIGKIIFACFYPQEYNNAIKQAQDQDMFISDTEENEFGLSHSISGESLAVKWNLPPSIVVPIRYHHLPMEAPTEFRKEALLAHMADHIVKLSQIGTSGDNNKISEISAEVYSEMEIDEDKIEEFTEKLKILQPKIETFIAAVF